MGNKLFAEVTELTGLPGELIGEELRALLDKKGVIPEQLTLESLREALSEYLLQLNIQMEAAENAENSRSSAALSAALLSVPHTTKAPTQ